MVLRRAFAGLKKIAGAAAQRSGLAAANPAGTAAPLANYEKNQQFHYRKVEVPDDLSPEALSNLVVFVHIPKCGGTTLKSLMMYNYGMLYQDFHPRLNDLHARIEMVGQIRAISAHKPLGYHDDLRAYFSEKTGELDAPFLTGKPLIVSTTRDPLARLVSTYNFVTTFPGHALYAETKDMEPESFFDFFIEKRPREVSNLQCFFISGVPNSGFEVAREALDSRFDMVVDVAQQDKIVDDLIERLSWKVPENFEPSNESPKKLRLGDMGSKLRQRLEALVEEDRKLADYVRERGAR